ncbi:MAG: ABC transporter permease [Ilumatobacteraceae bacterium]
MSRTLPARFWIEAITAAVGVALLVVTVFTREWFELLTGLDPDGGSGALEVALGLGLVVVAAGSALDARRVYVRSTSPV